METFNRLNVVDVYTSPVCSEAEPSYFKALLYSKYLLQRRWIMIPQAIQSYYGLTLRKQVLTDEETELILQGKMAGFIATDVDRYSTTLKKYTHTSWLQRVRKNTTLRGCIPIRVIQPDGGKGFNRLHTLLQSPSCPTEVRTRASELNTTHNDSWFAHLIIEILAERNIKVDREQFLANSLKYQAHP